MRRWLVLGVAALLTGAAAAAFALARLNAYLVTNRAALAAQASAAFGRPVQFDAIGVSLRGGGSAEITNLRIGDDPRFGDGDFLRADSAVVTIAPLAALRGLVQVRAVVVDAPRLILVRDAEGWNIDSLLSPPAGAAPAPPAPPLAATPAVATATDDAPPLAPRIGSLTMRNGTVQVTDRDQQPPVSLTIDQVDLAVSDWAPGQPVRLRASAALFGAAATNAELDGTVTPGEPSTADVSATWQPLALAAVVPLVPQLAQLGLQGEVGGTLRFNGPLPADGDVLSVLPLAALSGTLTLRDVAVTHATLPVPVSDLTGSIAFGAEAIELSAAQLRIDGQPATLGCRIAPPTATSARCQLGVERLPLQRFGLGESEAHGVRVEVDLPVAPGAAGHRLQLAVGGGQLRGAPLQSIAATGAMQDGTLTIEQATMEAFGGSARLDGSCTAIDTPAPECATHVTVQGARLAGVLAGLGSDAARRLDGRLTADLQVAVRGRDADALRRSLRGGGTVRIDDGVIHDLNLAQRVLGALPGVSGLMSSGGRVAQLLGSGDTRFSQLTATLRVADQRLASDDVRLTATDFDVEAAGSTGFAGDLSARGTFRGAAPLVDDLVGGVPLLGRLAAGSKGLIVIPFTVSGTIDAPRVEPDLKAVAGGIGQDAAAGLDALLGSANSAGGKAGGAVRKGIDTLDRLFGR